MIFRRKKASATAGGGQAVLRGRESAENSSNPLARRFHPDDEPDTIDLQQTEGFNAEPGTAGMEDKKAAPEYLSVVTLVPETGKFYLQPGQGGSQTYLGDEAVTASTELRQGDRIRVGDFEFEILTGQKNRD
jgi:hypothetical protein